MLSRKETPTFADSQQCQTYAWFSQRAWVEIDLGALSHNIREILKFLSPTTQLMAVVKADAYGHGSVTVAQTALESGASWLGVATVPEGIQLREGGIKAPILVLGVAYTPEQIHAIAHWKLQATLCSPKQALIFSNVLEGINYSCSVPVHIKLDTGMSRLGTNWQEAVEFVQLASNLPGIEIASVYSHLATADNPDGKFMAEQQKRFEEAIAKIKNMGIDPKCLHLANSAATLTNPALHYDMVRVGLAIYGLSPAVHLDNIINLQPVLQLKARVTQVKTIAAGTGVSYGQQFIAPQDMLLAVVGIGYADGVARNLSNNMEVLVRSQRVPQIGAITMDQLMIDVTTVPDLQAGEVVTLLGEQGREKISADDWAKKLNTISWEILCGFKHRLPRVAVI